jgi:DNA-binding NarL/FixJ family response regulator
VAETDARIRAVCVGTPSRFDGRLPLVDALADDIEIVTADWPITSALEEIAENVPDIVVLDYGDETSVALELVGVLRTRFPMMKLAVMGAPDDVEFARAALRLGARAYLARDGAAEDLAAALRAVQADHTIVDLDTARGLFMDNVARTPLRKVEVQVLRSLALGMTHTEISEQLEISRSTLKRYLNDIEVKLEARNRVQAVAHAAKQGLI